MVDITEGKKPVDVVGLVRMVVLRAWYVVTGICHDVYDDSAVVEAAGGWLVWLASLLQCCPGSCTGSAQLLELSW